MGRLFFFCPFDLENSVAFLCGLCVSAVACSDSGGLLDELEERLGEGFQASSHRLADGVLHGEFEAAGDFFVGLDAELAHLVDGPDPDVIFFLATFFVAAEANGVMANLVEKDREADGGLGEGGFDPVDASAIAMADAPGAAAHLFAPAFDADGIAAFHRFDDGVELGGAAVGHSRAGIGTKSAFVQQA